MNVNQSIDPDPAAVFGAALSLWQACWKSADALRINLSECYHGGDEFMRQVMRVGNVFEKWACAHINFNETPDVWPYLLEDRFGDACVEVVSASGLEDFNDKDCLRVALHLRLPVLSDGKLPLPVKVCAPNPATGSPFRKFRIQTMRDSIDEEEACSSEVYTFDDEPFDEEFGPLYFAVYGITEDGLLEHIVDRRTYAEAVSFLHKLVPGVEFPATPKYLDDSAKE